MPEFIITSPDGEKYRVKGESREGAVKALRKHLGDAPEPPAQEIDAMTPPAAPDQEPAAAENGAPQSMGGGVLDSLTQGLTLGFGDELTALEAAIVGREPGGGTFDVGSYDLPFSQRYDRALAAERGQQEAFGEANPVTDTAAEVGGAIAGAIATGGGSLIGNATTRSGQIGRAALGGAGGGAAYGVGDAEGGPINRVVGGAQGAAFGAVGGVVGRELGVAAGKVLRRLVGQPRMFDGSKLTPAGRKALADAGINPDQISDDFARAFAARVKQAGGQSDEAVRMAQADEFGIPLTRGQATGDVAESAFEEAARNQARGAVAGGVVRNLDDAARTRVRGVADDMAGGVDDALDVAEATGEAVKSRASAAAAARDAAYSAARESDAVIDVRAFEQLGGRIKNALNEVTLTPGSQARGAIREARRLADEAIQGPDGTVGVSFQAVEKLRQRLNRVFGATKGIDKQEVGSAIRALDDWVADSMDRALISGSDDALTAMQNARGLHAAYKRTFSAKPGDDASKVIEKMAELDVTPPEIANWLYGSSKVGAKGSSVRTVKKLREVLSPEQFEAVKNGAFRRVVGSGDDYGYKRLADRIEDFTSGEGRALAKELFSPEELARMQRFGKAIRILIPPAEATNPSKTAYGIARLGGDMLKAGAGYVGLASGGPVGGLGAVLAAAVPGAARNAAKAAGIPANAAGRAAGSATRGVVPGAAAAAGGVAASREAGKPATR